jgi:sigma-B regulation protein RsbU (phosphoserine phosphatase)
MEDQKNRIKELENELDIKEQELARANKELMRVNSVLEKMIGDFNQEIHLASLIQKALAPTEIPHIAGIEFSTKFNPGSRYGGDYFDIFEHEDKLKFGIILASSSGYAMSALFLSVLIRLSAQIEARKGLDPDKVIHMMAKELVPNIQNDDTASLFYGVIDRRSFELKYCIVGSILGIVQPNGTERPLRLDVNAIPLKKDYREIPELHKITLGPRDRIALCTPGVGEINVLNSALQKAPRHGVHELRNEILFQAEQKSGKSESLRDQTVIVAEIKDKVIKLAKK